MLNMRHSLKEVLLLSLVGIVCYFFTGCISLYLFHTIAIWPAAGIAFAFVFIQGLRGWVVPFAGTLFVVTCYVIQQGGTPFALESFNLILLTAIGNTIAVLLAVEGLKKFVQEDTAFLTLYGVVSFTLLGAGFAAIISATIGVIIRLLTGYISGDQFFDDMIEWTLGNFIGILILAPPIISWRKDHSIPPPEMWLELILVLIFLCFVTCLVFGPLYQVVGPQIGQPVLLMLPLAWSAIRLRLRITTLFMAITCFFMWWGTLQGYGVFHAHSHGAVFISSQTFLISLSITVLLVASLASGLRLHAIELEIDQQKMKLALDVADIAIWDRNTKTGENYSSLWLEMLGYEEGEILNNSDTWMQLLHPDDVERVLRYNKEYKQRTVKGTYQVEYRLRHKSGDYRWIEARTNETLGMENWTHRSSGILADITKWKEADQELRNNVHILETLERLSQIILDSSSLDQHLESMMNDILQTFTCSRAWLLFPCDPHISTWSVPVESTTPEYPGAFRLGQKIKMTPEMATLFQEALDSVQVQVFDPRTKRVAPAGEVFQIQSQLCMAIVPHIGKPWLFGLHQCDHPRIWSERDQRLFREIGLRVADGLSTFLLLRDLESQVSERTKELNKRNEELEAFAHTVSHDLRAPLRAMHGFAAALQEDYEDVLDETATDYSRRIIGAATHMDGLICDLLEYSHLGRVELKQKSVDLNSILSESFTQLQPEISDKEAIIEVQELLPMVLGNRTLVGQIVMNLLTNALKFIEPEKQPQIKIWTEKKNACIILWIEDNGIGISEEHQEKIFSVFERLHGIEKYPGTGIGLAIVRRAAEKMRGEVGIVSSLNAGSQFWVSLPSVD